MSWITESYLNTVLLPLGIHGRKREWKVYADESTSIPSDGRRVENVVSHVLPSESADSPRHVQQDCSSRSHLIRLITEWLTKRSTTRMEETFAWTSDGSDRGDAVEEQLQQTVHHLPVTFRPRTYKFLETVKVTFPRSQLGNDSLFRCILPMNIIHG